MNIISRMIKNITALNINFRMRFWWPGVLILAAFVYLYSLDGLYIPHVGDEAPYIQITRLTAENGKWLPLKAVSGLENTKPPMLFWQGIISSDWAGDWSLYRLRFPIVIFTFLTAGLVFILSRKISGSSESGYLGALSFLGFFSTFQRGRPFLTNMPETFFIFFPFFLLLCYRDRIDSRGMRFWLLFGFSVGIACLYRSVALVVPVGFALSWLYLARRDWNIKAFLKNDSYKLISALLLSLLCFALWLAFDPDPKAIFRQFIIGENVDKFRKGNYFQGLFTGPYPVYRTWLGFIANSGLFGLPLIYIIVHNIKHRTRLHTEEKMLWILILSFIIVFTVPSQRQASYLLPIMPAIAVLVGTRWTEIKRQWFYLFNIPLTVVLLFLTIFIITAADRLLPPGSYQKWQFMFPLLAIVLLVSSFFINRIGPYTFHLLIIMIFGSLLCALAPFHGPLGKFKPDTLAALKGKTVYVPSNFKSKYELHRFILPGTEIDGYDPSDKYRLDELLQSGQIVAVNRALDQSVEDHYRVYGTRLGLRSRHSKDEVSKIVFQRQIDLLIQQEIIIQRLINNQRTMNSEINDSFCYKDRDFMKQVENES